MATPPTQVPQPTGSPAGSDAAQVPVPDTDEQEEFDLFGPPGPAPNPFGPVASPTASPTGAQANSGLPQATPTAVGVDPTLQAMLMEMMRSQQELMRQNQTLVTAMMRRLDLDAEQRQEEAKRREEEKAAQAAAEAPRSVALDPFAEGGSASSSGFVASGTSFPGNRAEKYLPPLPTIAHGEMGKNRMKEVEEWHRFVEVLSSWLALIDEAYVSEFRLALRHDQEISQVKLAKDVAARSSKLFYYLGQSLAKWERGLELLRSVSKRQGMSAAGYEVVRTLHAHYSIVSRMEAVYVRDECLKLHTKCGHVRKPMDIVRHLEDELSKAEAKLSNFPDLRLSDMDKVSLLLQAIPSEVRQYVVLHGHSNDWKSLTASLKYYEEQLRMCETPANARAMDTLCEYCGKRGHTKDFCWQKKKDDKSKGEKGSGKKGGGKKGDKGKSPGGKGEKGEKGNKGKEKEKEKARAKKRRRRKALTHAQRAQMAVEVRSLLLLEKEREPLQGPCALEVTFVF